MICFLLFYDDNSSDGEFFGFNFLSSLCVGLCSDGVFVFYDFLDVIWRDFLEDFRYNGWDVELDEFDSY